MKRSSLLVLFLTVFIDLLGFGIVLPLLPYYAREYGASGLIVGMVVGVYSLMQFFFSPVWGRLSDRIGRRPVLLISLTGSAIGYLIFAFSQSLTLLFVARVVSGIAAANIGTAQAYIADSTSPENRAKGMGMIGAAFGLGFIFGPPVGGLLSSWGTSLGYHGNLFPGIAAFSLSVVALTVGFFALVESKPPDLVPRTGRPPQFDPQIWSLIGERRALAAIFSTLFLIILTFAAMETTVTLHGRDRFEFTARDLGFFFGTMGVIVALIQGGLIGPLSRAFGERRLVVAGAIALVIGFALVPTIYDPRFLYGVAFLIAVGQGLSYPSLTSLVTRVSPARDLGSILGISSSVGSLARMIGPVVGGLLYDAGGSPAAFYASAVLVVVAAGVAMTFPKVLETGSEPAPPTPLA